MAADLVKPKAMEFISILDSECGGNPVVQTFSK